MHRFEEHVLLVITSELHVTTYMYRCQVEVVVHTLCLITVMIEFLEAEIQVGCSQETRINGLSVLHREGLKL